MARKRDGVAISSSLQDVKKKAVSRGTARRQRQTGHLYIMTARFRLN